MKNLIVLVALVLAGCDAVEGQAPADAGSDSVRRCVGSQFHNVKCENGVCTDTYVVTCTWQQ